MQNVERASKAVVWKVASGFQAVYESFRLVAVQ